MAKQRKDNAIVRAKPANLYAEYRDKAFDVFFDSCIKATLQKNKSIYDLIQFCFNAGYWNAMRDIVNNKDLCNAAEEIIGEINNQK